MGFDPVARPYRALERLFFGDALQRARVAHLEAFIGVGDVLLFGDGDGRFLEALLLASAGDTPRILSVDASARMLELARDRIAGLPGADRVEFFCLPLDKFAPPAGFRAAVVGAHFFLDCFDEEELPAVLSRIGGWVDPDGRLVVSDFAEVRRGVIWRQMTRLMLWGMIRFFRFSAGISARRLPDLEAALAAAGWEQTGAGAKSWWGGFLFSTVWEKPLGKVLNGIAAPLS